MYEFGVSSGVLERCLKRNVNLGIVNIELHGEGEVGVRG